ncbi:MAG: hypothetical protein AAGA56_07315 [Myxococcota bacterium]
MSGRDQLGQFAREGLRARNASDRQTGCSASTHTTMRVAFEGAMALDAVGVVVVAEVEPWRDERLP